MLCRVRSFPQLDWKLPLLPYAMLLKSECLKLLFPYLHHLNLENKSYLHRSFQCCRQRLHLAFSCQILSKKYLKKSKNEQKDSKDKADSHRTTQPKDYGIMVGQKGGFAELLCDCPATLRDLFRFLLVFRLSALLKCLSFFSIFLF